MAKLQLFLFACIFLTVISFISISDYQPLVGWEITPNFKIFQNDLTNNFVDRKLKIAFWLNPRLSKGSMKYRRDFVMKKIIMPQNTGNFCFNTNYSCEMTLETDEKTLREADAIVFIEFACYFGIRDLPPNWQEWRRPEQIWAINIDESPANHPSTILDVFNWTLSYRQDSDIWLPYGKTVPKAVPEVDMDIMVGFNKDIPLKKWIDGKSKLVTGVISNCHTNSKRELILKEMFKTNRSVDIYGACGNVRNVKEKCGFYSGDCTDYWNNLAKRYKFYLAFENSLCVDYISEKFWRTLKLGMVPVVYGGADYRKLAPRGSYIDVNWFKSSEELMGYLGRIAGSEEEYRRFFEWRRYFEVREEGTRYMTKESGIWCEFCKKLRDLRNEGIEGNVKMVRKDWWSRMPNSNEKPCKSYGNFLNWTIVK